MKSLMGCLSMVVAGLGLVFAFALWGFPGFVIFIVVMALVFGFTPLGDWMDRMTERSEPRDYT